MQAERWYTFIKEALTSKKFWVLVSALVGGFALEGKAFTNRAFILVTGWLAAQGAADLGTALSKKNEEPPKL